MAIYKFSDARDGDLPCEQLELFPRSSAGAGAALPAEAPVEASGIDLNSMAAVVTDGLPQAKKRDRLLSSCMARLFFLVLLAADVLWMGYALLFSSLMLLLTCATGGKNRFCRKHLARGYLAIRRSVVCALSLLIALVAPGFGILVACAYFLMYDKEGIEEVVPASLREQFQDLFQPSLASC